MEAFQVDLKFEQGATYRKPFTWKAGKPAVPVDLTGCQAWARFRVTNPPSRKNDLLMELTTEDGNIVLGGTLGTVTMIVAEEVTKTFAWDEAVYQLYIRHPDATVTRLMQGKVEVDHIV